MPVDPIDPAPPTATAFSELALLAPLSLEELYASRTAAGTQLVANQGALTRALAASIMFCQRYTRRSLIPEGDDATAVTKLVPTSGRTTIRVPDVRSITELLVDGVAVTDYALLPDDYGRPAPRMTISIADSITASITGTFGFLTVPADIRDAIYTDAIRRTKDADAGFADRVELGDGTVMQYFRTLPARVQATYNSMRIQSDFLGAS